MRIFLAALLSFLALLGGIFIGGVINGDIVMKNSNQVELKKEIINTSTTNKFKIGDIVKPTYSDKKGCIIGFFNGLYLVHIDGFYNKYAYAEFKEFELELVK